MDHKKKDFSNDVKIENCILCGKETQVPVFTQINIREYYIEGCGQLCKECYENLKSESSIDANVSECEIEMLLQSLLNNSEDGVYEENT